MSVPGELLLVLDIGNTSITVGVFREERLSGPWRISTRRERTADEYGLHLRGLLQGANLRPEAVRHLTEAKRLTEKAAGSLFFRGRLVDCSNRRDFVADHVRGTDLARPAGALPAAPLPTR